MSDGLVIRPGDTLIIGASGVVSRAESEKMRAALGGSVELIFVFGAQGMAVYRPEIPLRDYNGQIESIRIRDGLSGWIAYAPEDVEISLKENPPATFGTEGQETISDSGTLGFSRVIEYRVISGPDSGKVYAPQEISIRVQDERHE